mmetsp:Transcript_37639/g.61458  ORF Transcript_37639/g.61458 Transcript_37639/m.61458 type:complete len:488 (-) Transcript_37639:266-1729(-)
MIVSFAQRDIARHLYSLGDVDHIAEQGISKFALGCAVGNSKVIGEMIEEVRKLEPRPYSRSANMLALLETRETSMRLSPLLLLVSAGKTMIALNSVSQDFQGVAKLLLKHGASPVAKDVLGKTICHFGAGAMATKMTLDVVDICIHAAKTHHLHDKEVELHSLNSQEMNGKVGIVGGFDSDTGRRSVYLEKDQREVWIKTENMKLTGSVDSQSYPPLTDIQDRVGSVSLHELCLPQQISGGPERIDVAEFLLQKHRTSIHTKDTEDTDGVSPFQMVSGLGQMVGARGVAKLIMEAATREARQTTKAKRQSKRCCANCKNVLDKEASSCSRCKVARYCGRECQVAHWKEHKHECKDLAACSLGVKLDPPNKMKLPFGMNYGSVSFQTGGASNAEGIEYKKPRNMEYDKKFVVKVQATGDHVPIFVYDQTKKCEFYISPGQTGFQEILTEIRNESAWQGQKTFMKVSFDRSGTCTMYPETAGVKAHYTW